MPNIKILEDVENRNAGRNYGKKKIHDLQKDHVFGKKHNTTHENGTRGALQPLNNGIGQDYKRMKLNTGEKTEKIICLDDGLKENIAVVNLHKELVNTEYDNYLISKKLEEKEKVPTELLHIADYRQDIWRYLQEHEKTFALPKNRYMLKQSDLSWNIRSILVDWLCSVAEEYKLCNETFHLSVNYIDRFLRDFAVVKTKFQLVGAAAMLLAGKMEEIYPIDVKEWSYLTGDAFNPRQIKKMEQLLVKVLKYRMQPPTMCTFIEQFCVEHNLDSKTMYLAMYISELVLLEGDEYLNHLPSKLAAASIALARYTLSKDCRWPKDFKKHCGYSVQQLSPVLQRQQQTLKDSPLKSQQAIQTKYKSYKYQKVALLKPRKLVLAEFEDEN